MTAVYQDASHSDDARRLATYDGDIFLTSPEDATVRFCDFAKELVEAAFGGLDPEQAQDHMSVERYVEILSALKPTFIHHPRSKELLTAPLSFSREWSHADAQ